MCVGGAKKLLTFSKCRNRDESPYQLFSLQHHIQNALLIGSRLFYSFIQYAISCAHNLQGGALWQGPKNETMRCPNIEDSRTNRIDKRWVRTRKESTKKWSGLLQENILSVWPALLKIITFIPVLREGKCEQKPKSMSKTYVDPHRK